MPKGKLLGIQVLRGIAAAAVLLAHLYLVVEAPGNIGRLSLSLGAIGVDIFFVISGFVVTMTVDRNPTGARGFLFNRASRVLPLYIAVSIPLLFVEQLSINKVWNTFALLPVWDLGAYVNPVHWFGWSVAAEMWFYAVFALALWISRRRANLLFAGLIIGFVVAATVWDTEWLLVHFMGTPLALEFLAGVVLYRSRKSVGVSTALIALALAGIWLFAISMPAAWLAAHGPSLRFAEFGFMRIVYWGVPAFLIVAGVVGFDISGKAKWSRPAVWFGDISYSFYLMQPFGILVMRWVDLSRWWWLAWPCTIATVLLMAAASNRWVERPMTQMLRLRFDVRKTRRPSVERVVITARPPATTF